MASLTLGVIIAHKRCSYDCVLITVLYCRCSYDDVLITFLYCKCSYACVLITVLYCRCSYDCVLITVLYCRCSYDDVLITVLYCRCSYDGVSMMVFSLFMTARMGLFQESVYSKHGKHPNESLFFNHALPLPGFLLVAPNIYSAAIGFNQSDTYV
ncbi:S35B4-like protein [Mya arenaria]|uniref:S35B4-like protein n=1 Tax=Mya arenaria TaxID=6604 RepID=A0ABY7FWE8_MYAAR|nr:S35B4-like protein [Mya arenaria]